MRKFHLENCSPVLRLPICFAPVWKRVLLEYSMVCCSLTSPQAEKNCLRHYASFDGISAHFLTKLWQL